MHRWLVLVIAGVFGISALRAVTRLARTILTQQGDAQTETHPGGEHAGHEAPVSMFDQALEFTENLPSRTASEFEGVRALHSYVLGMLPNTAQRLIDAKARGRELNAPDEALIRLCNRLFNESFAGYIALSHGLLGAALHHLRAAVETTNLAILFLDQPEHAERWLNDKAYRPVEVRKRIGAPEELRKWYAHLSKMTHANAASSVTSVYPLGDSAEALSYGGHHAPRTMASTAMAFVWVVLGFLRFFYHYRSDDLEEISLLWKPEVAEIASEIDLTWDRFIDFYEKLAEDIQREILALPEDAVRTPDWAKEILSRRASHSPERANSQP
ncbi:MAG: hypothetical protein OXE43_08745 [Chloroflexi bacterium]|nr:hypothetical protein [Chloroflexota bacterium]